MASEAWRELNGRIVSCRKCPRLVEYRESIRPKKAFEGQVYWRRPVTGFGDVGAHIVVVGLAPAAQGGERTGRVFTGDESARFLYRSLYEVGLANQPTSESRDDGLQLRGCYVTAAVKCAPPGDKPTPREFRNCSPYLKEELSLLDGKRAVVALGKMAFDSVKRWAAGTGYDVGGMKFSHGARYRLGADLVLYGCYHPSPRNTHTGKLNVRMMNALFRKVIRERAPEQLAVDKDKEERLRQA